MADYTIQEIDYLQDDATNWESTDPGNITLAHQGTPVTDSEANWEREHKCLRVTVSGDQSGDRVRLPAANFVDGVPSVVANAWFGFWIRASLTGVGVIKAIMSSDGVEETVTPNIAIASKWQFVYADLSDLTGTLDYFELEILATEGVTIEISRVWYVNESRQGGSGGTYTDEVIELTANWAPATTMLATNCLFVCNNKDFYLDYGVGNQFKGCYFYDPDDIGSIGGVQKAFKVYESGTASKFTGVTRSWIEKALGLTVSNYKVGSDIHNVNLYYCSNGLTALGNVAYMRWDYLYNINIYGCSKGITTSNGYNSLAVKNAFMVGGGYGIYARYGEVWCLNSKVSAVNPPTNAIYCGTNGSLNWLKDGADLEIDTTKITYSSLTKTYGVFLWRTANFVTNPVTQNVVVVGYSTKNSGLPTYNPWPGKPLTRKGITDASGVVQLYCLWKHFYTASGNEVYSDGVDKYHFKFINGSLIAATYDGDISSGIGSVDSPQEIVISPVLSITNQAHDVGSPYEVATDETFKVTADVVGASGGADVYVLIGSNRFNMTYNSGTGKWEVTISAGVIGISSGNTVTVCVSDKDKGDKEDCANPIDIVAPSGTPDLPLTVNLSCEKVMIVTMTLEEE